MFRKSVAVLVACLSLAACAASQPRVVQASAGSPDIAMTVGLATQIEMPDQNRVVSVIVGSPSMVSAEEAGDVVNLTAKGDAGETNLIIRARDEDGKVKIYQYHITVQKP
ncbi:MAG: hypothetical protein P4M13_06875 [Alphaproteobacteria bacterium]|nr:hypothetical protein [Alphaproteobacteria bacterium]